MELDLGLPPLRKDVTTNRTQSPRTQITHDMIVDYILLHPDHSYKQIGASFGYSEVGIGVIVRSDAFRARFEMRKTEMVDPVVMEKIEKRLEGLAAQSLTILEGCLRTSTDPHLALKTLTETNKALGYGASKVPQVQNNYVAFLPGPAQSSEAWQNAFGRPSIPEPAPQVVDAEVKGG